MTTSQCAWFLFLCPLVLSHTDTARSAHNTAIEREPFYDENAIKNEEREHLSMDCLSLIAEYLSNMTELHHFQLTSHRHQDACRSFLQHRFQDLRTIFASTTRQQRITSWTDIEEQIPLFPELYIKFFRETSARMSYYALLQFHEHSKMPIIRGLSRGHKLPFISLLLTTDTHLEPYYSILVLIFHKEKIQRSFIFDEHRHPRFLSFHIEDLDVLLNGHSLRFIEAKGSDRRKRVMLRRYWKLIGESDSKMIGESRLDINVSSEGEDYREVNRLNRLHDLCYDHPVLWTVVIVIAIMVLAAAVMSLATDP